MAEEDSPPPQSESEEPGQGSAGESDESPAGGQEHGEERVAELAREQDVETQLGPCTPEELERLRPICSRAEENYGQLVGLIQAIRADERTLQRFHAREEGVTSDDVAEAKQRFNKSKKAYLQLGNQINDGIKQVYELAKTYLYDYLVQNIYKVYLAKMLVSLETRNPVKPFIERFAMEGFIFEREEVVQTDVDIQRKKTKEDLEKKRLEDIQQKVVKLEARYKKRLLANRLRLGEPHAGIIDGLRELIKIDPDDVNTYIWVAKLLSGELKKERDQNKRVTMRDEVLEYCKKGFARIDDYLNLQMIESLNDRDKIRAGYVKTITAIRRPLLDQSN